MQRDTAGTSSDSSFAHVKTVLITGASGLIGGRLTRELSSAGARVIALSRSPKRHAHKFPSSVRWVASLNEIDSNENIELIVNLAGESLASGRWTDSKKNSLMESRAGLTEHLYDFFAKRELKPQRMISASAIGFYGNAGSLPVSEEDTAKPKDVAGSFSHQLCENWERQAHRFEDLGIKVCIVRFGVVFAQQAPAFKALLRPFNFKVASYFGDGEHYLSWIHIEDLVRAIAFILTQSLQNQTFNFTAPESVSYKKFAEVVGNKKSCIIKLPLPAAPLKCAMGQMASELLLQGQNVYPKHLLDQGFEFQFSSLQSAIDDLLS